MQAESVRAAQLAGSSIHNRRAVEINDPPTRVVICCSAGYLYSDTDMPRGFNQDPLGH